MSKLLELSLKRFKFGSVDQTLLDILGESVLLRVEKKYKDVEAPKLYISLRELCRYLYLASYAERSIFFPGDRLMDDLWHVLIVETAEYRNLCEQFKQGSFIDHSGVEFEDYLSQNDPNFVHEEQKSWLISYIKNFGRIEQEAFECLTLAMSLASHSDMNLLELNILGENLLEISKVLTAHPFDQRRFLQHLHNARNEVDSDSALLRSFLRDLFDGLSSQEEHGGLISNALLEEMFGASTAFAFVLWQHLAAVERLNGIPEWQSANQELWNEIKKGTILCGLATTHLAKPGGSTLTAKTTNDGFLLTGISQWVCGYQIFDQLLVGFETSDAVMFAIIPFPAADKESIAFNVTKMICLNGTATVGIQFQNYFVPSKLLVSVRKKTEAALPRPSSYLIPELGIGKKALQLASEASAKGSHPRNQFIETAVLGLKNRLNAIEKARESCSSMDILIPLRDDFNKDAIRLFSLSIGAQSMLEGSLVSRLNLESIFIDSLIQSPKVLEQKILRTGGSDVSASN